MGEVLDAIRRRLKSEGSVDGRFVSYTNSLGYEQHRFIPEWWMDEIVSGVEEGKQHIEQGLSSNALDEEVHQEIYQNSADAEKVRELQSQYGDDDTSTGTGSVARSLPGGGGVDGRHVVAAAIVVGIVLVLVRGGGS